MSISAAVDTRLPAWDDDYRQRSAAIAAVSQSYRPGEAIPMVAYEDDEHRLWSTVCAKLDPLHRRFACREVRSASQRLALDDSHVPQLRDVDRRLQQLSQFGLEPVPGLVPKRDFYGALARRRFLSTQYVRHPASPLYTPEPDIIHEMLGHATLLASPVFSRLHYLAGEASRRAVDDAALNRFSHVFWFTLEFGVVFEDDQFRAYGAGLLSSCGELRSFRKALIRPVDFDLMETLDYDISRYQPTLFAFDGFADLTVRLTQYFEEFGRSAS